MKKALIIGGSGGLSSVVARLAMAGGYEALGVKLNISEIPLNGYLEKHPEYSGHLCHRIYDLSALKEAGVRLPDTHLDEGIRIHLKALGY